MRIVALLVLALLCLIGADEKRQAPNGEPFAKPVKILKFGEINEYFEPAKADAVAALGLLGDERAVPLLAEHLANENDPGLRFQITRALGWIKSPKAVSALEKALKDDDSHVRNGAAMALKEITGKDYQVELRPAGAAPGPDELAKELARLQVGGRRPGPTKAFLEAGKTYHFTFVGAHGREVTGKVVEAPAEDWVKVQVRKGDRSATSWVNLSVVAAIRLDPDEK